jgi:hypothetical protein
MVLMAGAAAQAASDGSVAVEVRQDETLSLTYRARLEGEYLVVRAAVEPTWHTFAMDNQKRADEKLAGKPSLGIDRPTSIAVTGGLAVAGPWLQSEPKDFSKPELRWFSWGFEKQAVFAAKVKRGAGAAGKIAIKGQACTETVCKNIDVSMSLPAGKPAATSFSTAGLVQVR